MRLGREIWPTVAVLVLLAALFAVQNTYAYRQGERIIPGVDRQGPNANWDGVWIGSIGSEPVHACLDWDGEGVQGAFFYDHNLVPIRLYDSDGGLAEHIGFDGPNGNSWRVNGARGTRLTGTWRGRDGRMLPIRLVEQEGTPPNVAREACASTAFHGPRLAGSRWIEERGAINGEGYSVRTYVPSPVFGPDEDGFASLAFSLLWLDENQPGDALINKELAGPASDAAIANCFATSSSGYGSLGYVSGIQAIDVLTSRWLGISITTGDFCGGLHPHEGRFHRIYDRSNGAVVHPGDWLNPAAVTREWYESDGEHHFWDSFTADFREQLLARQLRSGNPDAAECAAIFATERTWDMGLTPRGLQFTAQLPHVVFACTQTVEIPWPELAPYLNDSGRAAMADLTAP